MRGRVTGWVSGGRTLAGGVIGLAVAATPAGALPPQFYQNTVLKICGGGAFCEVVFPPVPSNRTLAIAQASCRIHLSSRSAVVSHVQLQSDRGDGRFFLTLTPIANAEGRTFSAALQGQVAMSRGSRPRIALYASNSSSATIECGVAGRLEPVTSGADAGAAEP